MVHWKTWSALCAAILLVPGVASAASFSPVDYEELRQIVQEGLYPACPPDQNHYLFIGQTPTPLQAFVEGAGSPAAGNLPLSYASLVERALNVDRETKPILYAHFDRFIPAPSQLKGRRLCLVDLLISGATLSATRRLLKAYYLERYRRLPPMTTVGLDDRPELSQVDDVDFRIALQPYRELPLKMHLGHFEAVSPHGSFVPQMYVYPRFVSKVEFRNTPPPADPRRAYVEFRRHVLAYMDDDPKVLWFNCSGLLSR